MGNCCSTGAARLDHDATARRIRDQAREHAAVESRTTTEEEGALDLEGIENAIDAIDAVSSHGRLSSSAGTAKSQRRWEDLNGPFGLARNPGKGFTDAVARAAGGAWSDMETKSWSDDKVKQFVTYAMGMGDADPKAKALGLELFSSADPKLLGGEMWWMAAVKDRQRQAAVAPDPFASTSPVYVSDEDEDAVISGAAKSTTATNTARGSPTAPLLDSPQSETNSPTTGSDYVKQQFAALSLEMGSAEKIKANGEESLHLPTSPPAMQNVDELNANRHVKKQVLKESHPENENENGFLEKPPATQDSLEEEKLVPTFASTGPQKDSVDTTGDTMIPLELYKDTVSTVGESSYGPIRKASPLPQQAHGSKNVEETTKEIDHSNSATNLGEASLPVSATSDANKIVGSTTVVEAGENTASSFPRSSEPAALSDSPYGPIPPSIENTMGIARNDDKADIAPVPSASSALPTAATTLKMTIELKVEVPTDDHDTRASKAEEILCPENKFASVWKDANPQNGYLGAMDVQRVLKRSQLSDNILRRVWKAAKNPVPPLDKMNEAEFLRACQLVEEAGGTVLMGGGSSAGEPTPSISDAPAVPARSVAATDSSHLQHEYHSVWLLGEPTDGFLSSSKVQALLKKCGLPDNILRRVWTGAKRPVPPLNLMCEAEFLRACELVVASGGKIPETSAKVATSVMSVVPTKPAETPAQHTPYQYTDPLTSSESEQEDEVELETDEEIVAGASAGAGAGASATRTGRAEEGKIKESMKDSESLEGAKSYDIERLDHIFEEVWLATTPKNGSIFEGSALVALEVSQLPVEMLKIIVAAAKEHDSPIGSLRRGEFLRACKLVEEAGGVPLQHPDRDGILDAIWQAGCPQDGFIASAAVTAALRQYGLRDGDVRRCWREAKITSQPPLDMMNKVEWMKTCRLAVKAGGKPLDMAIATSLTQLGVVDEHYGTDDDLDSDAEVPASLKVLPTAGSSGDLDEPVIRESPKGGQGSDSDSSDPESDGYQRRLVRMQQRTRSATYTSSSFRVSPRRAVSASPPKQQSKPSKPTTIRRF